jgi:hypothetical protein
LLVLVAVGAWFAGRDPAPRPVGTVGGVEPAASATLSAATPGDDRSGAKPQTTPAQQAPARPKPAAGEAEAVERLRALALADPRRALELSAELDRRFPDSSFAEERASLGIDALVKLGDIGQARTNSEEFFARFPPGRFGLHVETLTGVHPRSAGEDRP